MNFLTALLLPTTIFLIGILGLLQSRKNVLLIIISIELMLLSINTLLLLTSVYLDDNFGQIFSIMILTIAAAETSIGLSILVAFYRKKGTILLKNINLLKG